MLTKKSFKRAFTMIEMLLVVAIIATLALIVVPRLTGRQKRAKVVAAEAGIKGIETSLDNFELDVGRYPTTEEGLTALLERPPTLSEEDTWAGPYFREIPLDPWNRPFVYRYPGEQNIDYDIICVGPDGEEGTEDDITNFRRREKNF